MKRKWFALILGSVLAAATVSTALASESATEAETGLTAEADPLSISDASVTEIRPYLDGREITVTEYEDVYCAEPNSEDQKISIYVPEGATADSPILFIVNNGGWFSDSYEERAQLSDKSDATEIVRSGNVDAIPGDYRSDKNDDPTDDDLFGAALVRNYVIVSYGCRGRNNDATDGKYLGHSPATITDTKAAIRYLRYNQADLPAGNTDKIVITGWSGGGALSADIAASGNSEDFYESLYEIGAAGIEQGSDGTYTSALTDDVFAVLAYCPINNLGPSDLAYEWTFYETRQQLVDEGYTWTYQPDENSDPVDVTEATMTASKELHDAFPDYLESLSLTTEDGTPVTSDNIDDLTTALIEKEIQESIDEYGVDQMRTDMATPRDDNTDPADIDTVWLTLNDDGTFEYGYQAHCLYLAQFTALKVAPAFSNKGLNIAAQNEDSLFGTEEYPYSAFEFYSWNNDATPDNGCGQDDTGMTWDEFLNTDEGAAVAEQIRMASPIPYLLSDTEGDSAPHWYIRHGLLDRDTSFANQTVLYYAMLDDDSIEDLNFEYAWLKVHEADYDITEAFEWLDSFL